MRSPTAARNTLVPALATLVLVAGAASHIGAEAGAQEDGRALAAELGCGGCHAGMPAPDAARSRVPALGPSADPLPVDFVFSYLADPVRRRDDIGRTRMPDFRLDEAERVALAALLGSGEPGADLDAARQRHPEADAALGRRIYAALGCAGCHDGVEGAEPVGGPDLSREGARVRADWLRAFLAAPGPVRADGQPGAAGARMPDFRLDEAEIGSLAALLGGQGTRFAPLDEGTPTRFGAARTERAVEGRFACLGCHVIGGRGGSIGPSLDGAAVRLLPSFVLEAILDPARAMPGAPMPHQAMPREEARRLARYVLSLDVGDPAERRSLADPAHPAWATPAAAADAGAALYARHCAACHGSGGAGDGWNAPSLPAPPTAHADAALMSTRVDDALFDAIHGGAWVLDGSPRMPPFGRMLAAEEIRALVATIRDLCACEGPSWSSDGEGR